MFICQNLSVAAQRKLKRTATIRLEYSIMVRKTNKLVFIGQLKKIEVNGYSEGPVCEH